MFFAIKKKKGIMFIIKCTINSNYMICNNNDYNDNCHLLSQILC